MIPAPCDTSAADDTGAAGGRATELTIARSATADSATSWALAARDGDPAVGEALAR
ncbi:hypothetical protein [Micromonospora sp. NPDC051296]|uniref:hypothetical protein n=1 Tax=Micromonospora sp. NPDC051296 TaxID=3155046 RepID=UPI00342C21DB